MTGRRKPKTLDRPGTGSTGDKSELKEPCLIQGKKPLERSNERKKAGRRRGDQTKPVASQSSGRARRKAILKGGKGSVLGMTGGDRA